MVDDYVASTATTGTVAVGGSATGNIETTGDADWFKVTLTAGTTHEFKLEGSDTGQGTLQSPYLQLIDSAGNVLLSDSTSGGFGGPGPGYTALLTYTATVTGTYYLASDPLGNDIGTYKISVSQILSNEDVTAPTLVMSSSDLDGVLRRGETTTLTFDFSEAVNGFTPDDVSVNPALGSLGPLVQDPTDVTIYHVEFTPTIHVAGALNIGVSGGYTDLAGNAGVGESVNLLVNTFTAKFGNNGINLLIGRNTPDTIDGLDGSDIIEGRNGNDWLFGGAGKDWISGGNGNDWLLGEAGNDILNGGDGADRLYGGSGNDTLTGNLGADLFGFTSAGFGNDRITDFRERHGDRIDLRGLGVSFTDLTISQSDAGAVVSLGTDKITLVGVSATSIDVGDFLLG